MLASSLERYQAIILPDSEQVSSALCAKLDAYVAQGGNLVCSGRSGHYDEMCAPRENSAFACLGIKQIGTTRDDMVSAMFLVGPEEKKLFPSFADLDAIAFGDVLTYQEYSQEAKTYFHLLPPQPLGPPERCYGGVETTFPGISVHPFGQGKGISIPFLLASLYYKEGYENSFFLLRDILTSLCGLQSVASNLTPMVEVTLGVNETAEFALVQLVNQSGHFGTSYFKPIPVDGIVVDIPMEEKVLSAQSLIDGRSVPFKQTNGRIHLEVNRIGEFESVKLALGKH
jgi:hypothetical protein